MTTNGATPNDPTPHDPTPNDPTQADAAVLDRLLRHDSDTTDELLEIAFRLTGDALDRTFSIGPGSVRATLEHIVRTMECWLDLMQENSIRPRLAPKSPLAELRDRLGAVSAELHAFAMQIAAAGRVDATFVDTLDDPPKVKTYGGALVHVATHGMHHRAQLLFMLKELGARELPEGDALGWERRRR